MTNKLFSIYMFEILSQHFILSHLEGCLEDVAPFVCCDGLVFLLDVLLLVDCGV